MAREKDDADLPLIAPEATVTMVQTTVAVEGMTCGACTSAIEGMFSFGEREREGANRWIGGFKDVDGVEQFTVSLITERAVAIHDASKVSAERIAEIIEERGFDARIVSSDVQGGSRRRGQQQQQQSGLVTTTVAVEGMTCGACTSAIEGGFKGVEGIKSFTVSLITERAVAVHDPGKVSAEKVAEMLVPFPRFLPRAGS